MDDDELARQFKRLNEATEMMIESYDAIADLLARLPLSVMIPRFANPEDWDAADALPAVLQARDAARDEPVTDEVRFLVDRVLLDWLAIYEMGCMARMAGPAPWRIDIMASSAIRLSVALNRASIALG